MFHPPRKKRTSEESEKLLVIQSELQKVDALLTADVGLLRDRIEEASYGFMEAQ